MNRIKIDHKLSGHSAAVAFSYQCNRSGYPFPSRRARDQLHSAVLVSENNRADGRLGPFTRFDEVARRRAHAKFVRFSRLREVVHFVVVYDASNGRAVFRSKPEIV